MAFKFTPGCDCCEDPCVGGECETCSVLWDDFASMPASISVTVGGVAGSCCTDFNATHAVPNYTFGTDDCERIILSEWRLSISPVCFFDGGFIRRTIFLSINSSGCERTVILSVSGEVVVGGITVGYCGLELTQTSGDPSCQEAIDFSTGGTLSSFLCPADPSICDFSGASLSGGVTF